MKSYSQSTKNNLISQGSTEKVAPDYAFPTLGLRHFWRFNETTAAATRVDAVGGVDLTPKNSPYPHGVPTGLKNGATAFNSGKIMALKAASTAASPNVALYSLGFSAGGWVKIFAVSATDTYDTIMGRYAASGTTTDQWLLNRDSPNNKWQMSIRLDDGTYLVPSVISGESPYGEFGVWQHVIGFMDYVNKTVGIYINGRLVVSSTYGAARTLQTNTSSQIFTIGAYNEGGNAQIQHANAIMSGLGIWDRPLTQLEISRLYNSGKGIIY